MSLRDSQRLLWQAIRWPTGVKAFLEAADAPTRDAFEATFRSTEELDAVTRVEVYADAYYWRLHGVLEEQFPLAAWILGDAAFRNLVTDYVLEMPSEAPDIRRFGERFGEFVRAHSVSDRYPGLAELIDADGAQSDLLDERDDPSIGASDLAEVPPSDWPELRFDLVSAARVVRSRWDFANLWKRCRSGTAPPAPPDLASSEPLHAVLVWREGYDVYHRLCEPGEGAALEALAARSTFSEICDAAQRETDASPEDVSRWLARWIGAGLIARFSS